METLIVQKRRRTNVGSELPRISSVNSWNSDSQQENGNVLPIQEARRLMGLHFWGPEEWGEFFNIRFGAEQPIPPIRLTRKLLESPYPFYENRAVKETNFLFLGLERLNNEPLNLLVWHRLYPKLGRPVFDGMNRRYDGRQFAEAVCAFRWHLIPIGVLAEDAKTWPEQMDFLSERKDVFEVPSVIELVTSYILYFLKKGTTDYGQLWGRTSNTVGNQRVAVGDLGQGLIRLGLRDDNEAYHDTGLAVSWRSISQTPGKKERQL